MDIDLGIWLCQLFGDCGCVGGFDITFVGDVHGLAFLWVEVNS